MRIFGKKKKEDMSELLLVQVQEKKQYDFFAALAKALLLFLLVYGALGGFLSAFEIEYNKGLCMIVLFFLALILSATYETGKRWLTNLLSMVLFGVYLLVAISNYWIINSGYYAIMNVIFGKARDYLGISGGVEYTTVVQDEYSTVTLFVLFLGMVGVILLNIQMQSKCSLFKVMLLTFTPYIVPFYLECAPSLIYILLLFTGYLTVAVLQNGNVRERLSTQMRYVLPLAFVIVMLIVRGVAFVLPENYYNYAVSESTWKTATRESVGEFARYGMSALFQRGSVGAGMSGGKLSKAAATMPSYETDLLIRYTPYSYDGMYLKAFTGKDYTGDSWTAAEEDGSDDGQMAGGVQGRKAAYEQGDILQGRGIMEVEYVGASKAYEYRPYYTDYEEVKQEGNVFTYTYYPVGGFCVESEEVDPAYLTVPSSCEEAVRTVCEDAGLSGNAEEIAYQVVNYFNENYSYTLRPGFYYGNPDYISHFLLESKRGYCSHFASSATMLFRYMGIPARFVEGYAFSYADVVDDGFLVEGADYSEYYDGHSALGETALIEVEIPDASAHAWVEIYVEGAGWVVVDPTPASSEEQENMSFWDAFMNMGGESDIPNLDAGDFGAYLETALSGVSYVLVVITIIAMIVILRSMILRIKYEKSLSDKERVCLAYTRLLKVLKRRNKEHDRLRTPAQQIDYMRDLYGLEISKEQEEALYQAFFAQEISYDADELCREIVKLQRMLRLAKVKKKQ